MYAVLTVERASYAIVILKKFTNDQGQFPLQQFFHGEMNRSFLLTFKNVPVYGKLMYSEPSFRFPAFGLVSS